LSRSAWVIVVASLAAVPVRGEEQKPAATPDPEDEALELVDLILQHHIDPPTRQEMVLAQLKALFRTSGRRMPVGLSRRVSEATSDGQLRALVRECWEEAHRGEPQYPTEQFRMDDLSAGGRRRPLTGDAALREAMRFGLIGIVPSGVAFRSAREFAVDEQFQSNRYVGTGIALAMQDGTPTMADVFDRGPVQKAGGKAGDRIIRINGQSTAGMELRDVVELLRGPVGTGVQVEVRQPDATATRTLLITRDVVPLTTIKDYQLFGSGAELRVAYLRVDLISASAAHELEQYRQRLSEDGARALVLDLRGLDGGSVHNSVLLADALLDGGVIGRARSADREDVYSAEPDELFPGLPLGILVDQMTAGPAEWLAAALRDNHRAVIIGEPTAGIAYEETGVPLPDGKSVLVLPTALLERGDGRPLYRPTKHSGSLEALVPETVAPLIAEKPDHARKHSLWGVSPDVPLRSLFVASGTDIRSEAAAVFRTVLTEKQLHATPAEASQ
jgi:carboxyl-terminal processing protease